MDEVTIVVRVVKDFSHRIVKYLVLHNISLDTRISQLKEIVLKKIEEQSGWKPYRGKNFDTMMLHHVSHGAKSDTLTVSTSSDQNYLPDEWTLQQCNCRNESEISFFRKLDFDDHCKDPSFKWEI